MRFLLNMNLPRKLCRLLAEAGHVCRHCGDVGLARAADPAIVEMARAHGEAVLTHDLDYGGVLAFSGQASPSVVIFRLRNTNCENLRDRLLGVWPQVSRPLAEGAIVVIEDAAVRIRALPIARREE